MSDLPSPVSGFPAYLASVRGPMDAEFLRLLPATNLAPTRIHQAMHYSLFIGGKRVRPALVLLAGDTLGTPRDQLLPGAVALEMIHTYSLIHDDLPAMDNDDLRRGQPTLHKKYDEATAILAGDALLTLGLTVLATEPETATSEQRRQAVALVGEAIGSLGMIGGQADDMAAENDWPSNAPAALQSIHQRKTGALLTACVRLAGVYADVDEDTHQLLTEIGDAIGLMFQVADDILDVEGTAATLGKTAGKDAAAAKLTYPGLHGLAESKKMLQNTHDTTLDLVRRLPRQGGLFPSLIHYLATRDR